MSESPELRKIVSERLIAGTHECVICLELIKRHDELWSCRNCFGVFHFRCMKAWVAKNAEEREQQLQSTSGVASVQEMSSFSCAWCRAQYRKEILQRGYVCFCGKVEKPAVGELLTPGSCGNPCERHQPDPQCVHRCVLMCHPGPCPPCTRTREVVCYCGKQTKVVGCSSGTSGFECDGICGKPRDCGKHCCTSPCHEGPCPICTVVVKTLCHCGASHKWSRCGDPEALSDSTEGFCCGVVCQKMRDCGNHICGQLCHTGPCELCYRTPQRQVYCPCGKARVTVERSSCLDPVPSCGSLCQLPLPCGDLCQLKCHDDTPCAPCKEMKTGKCTCGKKKVTFPCFVQYLPPEQYETARVQCGLPPECIPSSYPPKCKQVCRRQLSCERHHCKEVCCTDLDHTCYQICTRKLTCGQHQCGQLCHDGRCAPCTLKSYSRLYCRCRETWVEPPVPCGQPVPECSRPCSIPRPCGHPPYHTCHASSECPKCVVPVEKLCASHHKPLPYHHPCHLVDVSCGRKCGKHLPCCGRPCALVCHGGVCEHKCTQRFPTLTDVTRSA